MYRIHITTIGSKLNNAHTCKCTCIMYKQMYAYLIFNGTRWLLYDKSLYGDSHFLGSARIKSLLLLSSTTTLHQAICKQRQVSIENCLVQVHCVVTNCLIMLLLLATCTCTPACEGGGRERERYLGWLCRWHSVWVLICLSWWNWAQRDFGTCE